MAEDVLPGVRDAGVPVPEEGAHAGGVGIPSAADVLFFSFETVRGVEARADLLGGNGGVRPEDGGHERVQQRVARIAAIVEEEVRGT
jgi:hypothetical protein